MSERDGFGDGLCSDGAPDFIPPRASRGRRSGVILPGGGGGGGQDTDTILLESVKAAPRRSSIIKVAGHRTSRKSGGGEVRIMFGHHHLSCLTSSPIWKIQLNREFFDCCWGRKEMKGWADDRSDVSDRHGQL
eukprot:superscaffoldBa00000973_g8289